MNWKPWISFFVPGVPKPAGSKKLVGFYKGKKGQKIPNIQDDCKGGKAWRKACAVHARQAYRGLPLGKEALFLDLTFYMPRPKNHFRTGRFTGLLKEGAPCWHLQAPDTTKLVRCIEDAFSCILYHDDPYIIEQRARKFWVTPTPRAFGPLLHGDKPGALVKISRLPEIISTIENLQYEGRTK